MQHKILLLDELGERWGESHTYYDLRSPADAIRLLCINYPDFGKYIATSHEQGIAYQVTQVGHELEASELTLPLGQHDLVITPVIIGSKGVGKALLGAVLIGAAVLFPGAQFSGLGFVANPGFSGFQAAVGNIGFALVFSGVGDMLAPQLPTFDNSMDVGRGGYLGGPTSLEKGADGQQSYAYRGASNTVGIGKAIPLVYGKALVGSHLISTDIEVVNDSDPLMTHFESPSNGTVRVNGQKIEFSTTIKEYDDLRAARIEKPSKMDINEDKGIQRFHQPNSNRINAYDDDSTGLNLFKFRLRKELIENGSTTSTPNKIGFVDLIGRGEQRILDELIIDSNNGNLRLNTNFNVMITFSGLQDRIGDDKSTIIPGFITFAIIVKHTTSNSVVLFEQLTVQGTQNFSQSIRFIFNFEPVVINSGDSHKVFVQTIETGLFKTGTSTTVKNATKMRIDSVGYNLLGE